MSVLKKRRSILQLLIVVIFAGNAAGSNSFIARECEDVRYANVRFGSSYTFFHELTNSSAKPVYMLEKQVGFVDKSGNVVARGKESRLLQRGSPFKWSTDIVAKKYAVPPATTIETVSTGSVPWRIDKRPQWRRNINNNEFDFMIQYQVTFSLEGKRGNRSAKFVRTACNYYAVTWCGDHYLDSNYLNVEDKVASEECDDGNQSNGDGCNSVCMLE